jgi:hypothetical protein
MGLDMAVVFAIVAYVGGVMFLLPFVALVIVYVKGMLFPPPLMPHVMIVFPTGSRKRKVTPVTCDTRVLKVQSRYMLRQPVICVGLVSRLPPNLLYQPDTLSQTVSRVHQCFPSTEKPFQVSL